MKTPKPNKYYRAFLEFMVEQEGEVHLDVVAAALGVTPKTVGRFNLELFDRNLVTMSSDGRYMLRVLNHEVLRAAIADPACGTMHGFDRMEIFERDGWKCVYCGAPLIRGNGTSQPNAATLDHIKPRSKGGWDNLENLATACRKCNSRKGVRVSRYEPH